MQTGHSMCIVLLFRFPFLLRTRATTAVDEHNGACWISAE